MTLTRPLALGATAVLALAALTTPAAAAADTELTVHYFTPGHQYTGEIDALSLAGTPGTLVDAARDDFGAALTFTFPAEEPDAYLGFTIGQDGTFPDATRYVRATDGVAEVWVVDGDPRAYAAPVRIDPAAVVREGAKAYIAVEDLTELLGLTYSYGTNGYRFDGAAPGTIDILTIHRGRDYYEIAVDRDRIGANVTGNMLGAYNDLVFDDVDGFRHDGRYYLSFGYLERLFQVRTLVLGDGEYLLEKQFVAHDELSAAAPADVGFDEDRLAELDTYVEGQVAAGASAVAVVVTKDGKVVKEDAWGDALRYSTTEVDGQRQPAQLLPVDQRVPATTDTLFDLASNSKMYATNYAIQRLVSEGRLDLDRTLASFPGWEGFTDENSLYTGKWTVGGEGGIPAVYTGKETITIRDILHHYAGLIPDPEYPNLSAAGDLWYQTTDHTDRAGIVEKISQTPLRYQPRTVFAYSDVDYMILGLLVEQITGQSLDEYLEEEFYGPLGLSDTMFDPLANGVPAERIAATELNGNTRDGNVSFGQHEDGTPVYLRDYTLQGEVHDEKAFYSMAGVAGHAGLFSTTSDMAVLTQLMLGGGIYGGEQYFTQEVIEEFLTPYHIDPAAVDGSTIALGWRVHSKSAAAYYYFNWGPSRSTFGHQGWTGTLTVIDPLHDLTITILTNMRHSPVVDPPNGFAGAGYPIANMVPISAYVYRALDWESEQYNPLVSIGDVADVTVPHGTDIDGAVAALGATVDVTDTAGITHAAPLGWEIPEYDGATPGAYEAHATFDLPAGVTQAQPPVELTVTATVTVAEPVDPDPSPTDPDPSPTDPDPSPTDPDPSPTDPDPSPTDPDPSPTDPSAGGDPTSPAPTGPPGATAPGSSGGLPATGSASAALLALAAAVVLGAGTLLAARRRLVRG